MSQTEESFEFEDEMTQQVAGEVELAEKVAETKASDPDQVEVPEDVVEEPAKTDTEVEPEVEPTTTKKEDWTLSAVMDERDKRQKAVAKVEELEAKLAAYETKPEDADISMFEDEPGHVAQQEQKTEAKIQSEVLKLARSFAIRELGLERVEKAEKWYAAEGMKSPYAIDRINNADLKFHEAVELHEADMARSDPEGYKAKVYAEVEAKYLSENKPEPTITQSLASKRSAGEPAKLSDDPVDILGD
jgi:hypothetical protein